MTISASSSPSDCFAATFLGGIFSKTSPFLIWSWRSLYKTHLVTSTGHLDLQEQNIEDQEVLEHGIEYQKFEVVVLELELEMGVKLELELLCLWEELNLEVDKQKLELEELM